jgi:2-keto-4-pentenoate hydratase
MSRVGAGCLALLIAACLSACATRQPDPPTCPDNAAIAEMTRAYAALEPLPNPSEALSLAGAVCGRDKFVRLLGERYGKVVGYKAALTNPAVQKRFNYPAPVRGTLLDAMIVADGAEVPAKFGALPVFEADLVVVVRDASIHEARTPEQVLASIVSIRPFIELPDLIVKDPSRINGPTITLINAGTRLGVLGAPIAVTPSLAQSGALSASLRDMTVRVIDGNGRELDSGKGSAILDHPLNAVIWLADDLKKSGITLKPGDLLSLGSFSRLLPPQAGQTVRVVYEGLPGNPSVSVRFR